MKNHHKACSEKGGVGGDAGGGVGQGVAEEEEEDEEEEEEEEGWQTEAAWCCRGPCRANPALKKGRRLQLLQMLALPFVPVAALIVQNAINLNSIVIYRREVSDVDKQVRELSSLECSSWRDLFNAWTCAAHGRYGHAWELPTDSISQQLSLRVH
ncbi:hypothetical protein J437_LFUL004869 [Ladona fulva]|uniref:Uncharacterized protein n=1 Tax=Ladona fulva TaxID=123851 RepID=A0A8K0NRW0_LADFU|nr:hypothetical protein J437_LFUL004869 [Ladona fulva]